MSIGTGLNETPFEERLDSPYHPSLVEAINHDFEGLSPKVVAHYFVTARPGMEGLVQDYISQQGRIFRLRTQRHIKKYQNNPGLAERDSQRWNGRNLLSVSRK